nr:MAG TPA: hypothetical protein [Caudoviricetes sp.]
MHLIQGVKMYRLARVVARVGLKTSCRLKW